MLREHTRPLTCCKFPKYGGGDRSLPQLVLNLFQTRTIVCGGADFALILHTMLELLSYVVNCPGGFLQSDLTFLLPGRSEALMMSACLRGCSAVFSD